MSQTDLPLIVVVDGGGTTSRAAVCAASGEILGRATGSAANVTTDFDGALSELMDTVRAAYGDAGLDPNRFTQDAAFLGLAGANVGDTAKRMEARLSFAFARARVVSDRQITVEGALGPGDGTVALLGTGSFFVRRAPDGIRSVGGWGFQLGDDFGGAWLGRRLLRHSILAYDGLAPASDLTTQILAEFGGTPDGLVTFAKSALPSDYGHFAPRIVAALEAGDPVANAIIGDATAGLVSTLKAIGAGPSERLCMLGGLGPFYAAQLPEAFQSAIVPPLGDGIDGAIALARTTFAEAWS